MPLLKRGENIGRILAGRVEDFPTFRKEPKKKPVRWAEYPDFRLRVPRQMGREELERDHAYDVAILTIGIMPQRIFVDSGVETSEDGALLVNDYLQSTSYPDIFGAGDCIQIRGRRLDRVGVYAVRESPILFGNLLATLEGC